MAARNASIACALAWLASAIGCEAASAARPTYAPLDHPGPPLAVPLAQLKASLYCEPAVANARVDPVLLNPPSGATAQDPDSWNWEPALAERDARGLQSCDADDRRPPAKRPQQRRRRQESMR
jgi:hypothetical protein